MLVYTAVSALSSTVKNQLSSTTSNIKWERKYYCTQETSP